MTEMLDDIWKRNEDISPIFKPNLTDSKIVNKILKHEGTPRALQTFDKYKSRLSDYAYWHVLGNLWVSSSDNPIEVWLKLFNSNRAHRLQSLMKPSEFEAYNNLQDEVRVYRALRSEDDGGLSFTLDLKFALKFAKARGRLAVGEYLLSKEGVYALFLRRGESEVLVLNKRHLAKTGIMKIE
ncbi:hypothetical protein [Vibrio cholerae]|uniref:hypothetical protein n=1 Tax=Vibrio cholerae TaxID=666 RepID=UPI0030800287